MSLTETLQYICLLKAGYRSTNLSLSNHLTVSYLWISFLFCNCFETQWWRSQFFYEITNSDNMYMFWIALCLRPKDLYTRTLFQRARVQWSFFSLPIRDACTICLHNGTLSILLILVNNSAPLWPKRLMELKNESDYNLCNLELSLELTLDLIIWQV